MNRRELKFFKNYDDSKHLIYHPAIFYLGGEKYSPDFYDKQKNLFIEVAGTRQAFHSNKQKYKKFKKVFPNINFKVLTPSGVELNNAYQSEVKRYKVPSKLLEYFKKNELKPTPWAVKNGLSPAVISRYLNGKDISIDNAKKIQDATRGVVTVIEILFRDN